MTHTVGLYLPVSHVECPSIQLPHWLTISDRIQEDFFILIFCSYIYFFFFWLIFSYGLYFNYYYALISVGLLKRPIQLASTCRPRMWNVLVLRLSDGSLHAVQIWVIPLHSVHDRLRGWVYFICYILAAWPSLGACRQEGGIENGGWNGIGG